MAIPLVDLKAQYRALKSEIDPAIQRVLDNTSFILGEEVKRFEANFAAFCGVKNAVGLDSGSAALHLALAAAGVGPGEEVIVPSLTFIATASAVSHTGAKPVFVDVEPDTFNMDPERVEAAITPRTTALMPVHLYGQPASMGPLMEIAGRRNLKVIEDAAQSHGAAYEGKQVGGIGLAGIFSFYPGKNLGAYGDAGMLVSNDDALAETARLLRNQGRRDKYEHLLVGYNYRLDALQAAILDVKLRHLADWNRARQDRAKVYDRLLEGLPVTRPAIRPDRTHVFHVYVIRVARRDDLSKFLKSRGIETIVHYPIPLHLQPAYKELGYRCGDLPVTEKLVDEILSLPMYPELTDGQQEEIVAGIRDFLGA
jgi:dTDP-4-amino-4,6-dideoxygalactose transaminase